MQQSRKAAREFTPFAHRPQDGVVDLKPDNFKTHVNGGKAALANNLYCKGCGVALQQSRLSRRARFASTLRSTEGSFHICVDARAQRAWASLARSACAQRLRAALARSFAATL